MSTDGVSRAGSHVMKRGRSGGRDGEGEGAVGGAVAGSRESVGAGVVELMIEFEGEDGDGETRSIIRAILSSSSGQMSGQCVNPK